MPRPYSDDPKTEGLHRFLEMSEYQSKSFVTVQSRATYGAAPTTVREAADFGVGGLSGIVGVDVDGPVASAGCVLVLSNTILTGVTMTTIPDDAIVIPMSPVGAVGSQEHRVYAWPTAVNRRYCGIVTPLADTAAQYIVARILLNTDFDAVTPKWYGMASVADA